MLENMRVGLDATPLLGHRTGVGRYVEGLVGALPLLDDPPELVLTPFTWRGLDGLPSLPRGRRAPARLLQAGWQRTTLPPVEWLSGDVDVFHGTNFVAPPTRHAGSVVTIHDLSYLRHADAVTAASLRYRQLVPRALGRGAVVCTPSRAVADEVLDAYGIESARVVVTPHGISPEWLATAPPDAGWLAERGLPERYVLAVGNLEPRKNLTDLVAAMAALHADDPDTPPLVLVGPPGWGPVLDASALPASAVVLTGFLPDGDLRTAVAGAAVLAYPSRYEGFGLPPLEALACGTPVVVSDIPVLHEVLTGHARYVPVGDVDALAAALAATLDSPGDDSARRAHAATFTWARAAELTRSAYRLATR